MKTIKYNDDRIKRMNKLNNKKGKLIPIILTDEEINILLAFYNNAIVDEWITEGERKHMYDPWD